MRVGCFGDLRARVYVGVASLAFGPTPPAVFNLVLLLFELFDFCLEEPTRSRQRKNGS